MCGLRQPGVVPSRPRDASWCPPNSCPHFGSPLRIQYLVNQEGQSHAGCGRGTSEEMMLLLITVVTFERIILRT